MLLVMAVGYPVQYSISRHDSYVMDIIFLLWNKMQLNSSDSVRKESGNDCDTKSFRKIKQHLHTKGSRTICAKHRKCRTKFAFHNGENIRAHVNASPRKGEGPFVCIQRVYRICHASKLAYNGSQTSVSLPCVTATIRAPGPRPLPSDNTPLHHFQPVPRNYTTHVHIN